MSNGYICVCTTNVGRVSVLTEMEGLHLSGKPYFGQEEVREFYLKNPEWTLFLTPNQPQRSYQGDFSENPQSTLNGLLDGNGKDNVFEVVEANWKPAQCSQWSNDFLLFYSSQWFCGIVLHLTLSHNEQEEVRDLIPWPLKTSKGNDWRVLW